MLNINCPEVFSLVKRDSVSHVRILEGTKKKKKNLYINEFFFSFVLFLNHPEMLLFWGRVSFFLLYCSSSLVLGK